MPVIQNYLPVHLCRHHRKPKKKQNYSIVIPHKILMFHYKLALEASGFNGATDNAHGGIDLHRKQEVEEVRVL